MEKDVENEEEYPYKVRINDGFCIWEYTFRFESGGEMSIEDIAQGLSKCLNGIITDTVFIKKVL
jgi:hypothetical protein